MSGIPKPLATIIIIIPWQNLIGFMSPMDDHLFTNGPVYTAVPFKDNRGITLLLRAPNEGRPKSQSKWYTKSIEGPEKIDEDRIFLRVSQHTNYTGDSCYT